jgi:stage II sporulation protein D
MLAVALLVLPSGCTPPSQSAGVNAGVSGASTPAGVPLVRVLLASDEQSVRISATAAPVFRTTSAPRDTPLNIAGRAINITLNDRGWVLGGAQVSGGVMTMTPRPEGSLSLNGQPYRGTLRFVPSGSGRFDVVNDVDVESYLKSVVSRELLKDWDPEAFRAQAIVARTYVLYEVATAGSGRHWDVFADERSQVYGGMNSETGKSFGGVDATRGIVMAFGAPGQERIFKAYFSSCCGGIGQSAQDAFGDAPIPPLMEKNAGSLCAESPRYNWGPVTLSKAEVSRRIRAWGVRRDRPERNIGEVSRISVSHVNRFGRPVRFLITDTRGVRYSLRSEELRWAINGGLETRTLWSSFIGVRDNGGSFTFAGRGSGHGVGMCQYCAQAMALRGSRHEDIVRYSYPGVRLVKGY